MSGSEDVWLLRDANELRRANGPIHGFFGLTYSSYFVVPRIVLSSMPATWQARFVDLFGELGERIGDGWEPARGYAVFARGVNGRFEHDPFSEYRRAALLPVTEGPLYHRDEEGAVVPPTPRPRAPQPEGARDGEIPATRPQSTESARDQPDDDRGGGWHFRTPFYWGLFAGVLVSSLIFAVALIAWEVIR